MPNVLFKKGSLLTVLFLSSLLPACTKKPSASIPGETSGYPVVQIVQDPTEHYRTPDYTILSAGITKNVLTVLVQFGGGCRKHQFELKSNGQPTDSVFELYLFHLTTDDPCRRLLTDTLQFDLASLQKISDNYSVKIHPIPQLIPSR
jgi:hypothetical protein